MTAPTAQIVEREARTGPEDGRKMQGRRSGLAVIGQELKMAMTLGASSREAHDAGERASQTRWDGRKSMITGQNDVVIGGVGVHM